VTYGALSGSGLSFKRASTVVNVAHGVITFLGLHWAKGSPDPTAQGERAGRVRTERRSCRGGDDTRPFSARRRRYDHLTVWEQIDGGRPWTAVKQIFLLVPTVMMLLALNAADYEYVVQKLAPQRTHDIAINTHLEVPR